MKIDTLIRGGTVVTSSGRYAADIGIKDGRIALISADTSGITADETIDASGKYIMPGAIDGHLHYQAPVRPNQEEVEYATQAAAAGGITTGICMTVTYTDSAEGYRSMQEYFRGKAYIDYAFHGFAKPTNIDRLEELWTKTGVAAVKAYTTYANKVGPRELYEIFEQGRRSKGLTMIHAENDDLVKMFEDRLKAAGRKDPHAHVESRPPIVETECVRQGIQLLKETGSQALFVHISTCEALKDINEARVQGVKVFAETCPHYLFFNDEDIRKQGPYLAFTPVMRDEENRLGLWELLDKGFVTVIGSDHCPCEKEVKEASWDDIWKTHFGLSSLEAFMPVLFDGVNKGLASLERIVQITSENPAKVYGLYPKKGFIGIGADADLIMVDMDKEYALEEKDLKAKSGWSPFLGILLKGWPVLTMVRGQVVMKDMKTVGAQGFGEEAPRMYPFELGPDLSFAGSGGR